MDRIGICKLRMYVLTGRKFSPKVTASWKFDWKRSWATGPDSWIPVTIRSKLETNVKYRIKLHKFWCYRVKKPRPPLQLVDYYLQFSRSSVCWYEILTAVSNSEIHQNKKGRHWKCYYSSRLCQTNEPCSLFVNESKTKHRVIYWQNQKQWFLTR